MLILLCENEFKSSQKPVDYMKYMYHKHAEPITLVHKQEIR